LIRHGESLANLDGRFSGWSDVPLSALGEEQARALRPFLEQYTFDSVFSSDLQRARRTAQLAIQTAPQIEQRLREMHFGKLEGSRWEDNEHSRALLAFVDFAAPGGENLEQFRARVLSFVETLPAGRHLLFTHGGVIRSLAVRLGIDRFIGNAGCVVIDWSEQQIVHIYEPWQTKAYAPAH
jgi:probable phosphoglycerate mutase